MNNPEPTLFRWQTSWGEWTYRAERPAGWKDLRCFEAYILAARAPQGVPALTEPVAWHIGNADGSINKIGAVYIRRSLAEKHIASYEGELDAQIVPLYATAQPVAVPALTDDQEQAMFTMSQMRNYAHSYHSTRSRHVSMEIYQVVCSPSGERWQDVTRREFDRTEEKLRRIVYAAAPQPFQEPEKARKIEKWGHCWTCGHDAIPGESCARDNCPNIAAEPKPAEPRRYQD